MKTRTRARRILTLCAVLGHVVPGRAEVTSGTPARGARDDAALARARARYRAGADAFEEGRYRDAIDLFKDAAKLAPNPAFSYNIGLAYERLNEHAKALRWYRDYLRREPAAPDREEVGARIINAEANLFGEGVQQVTVLTKPEQASIVIDGDLVGESPWTGELAPGQHQMTVEREGYATKRLNFVLPQDHAIDVETRLDVMPEGQSERRAPVRAPPLSKISPLTWVALGTGVVGLGVSLGLESARAGAVSDADNTTQLEGKEELDRARSLQTAARIALGLGLAAGAAGGVLLYLDLRPNSDSGATARAVPACGDGEFCGVVLDGRF